MKLRIQNLFVKSIVSASLLTLAFQSAQAASGTWTGTTTGQNWSASANWSSGSGPVADGATFTADFSTADIPAGAFGLVLDSAKTIGFLNFGDSNTATAGT